MPDTIAGLRSKIFGTIRYECHGPAAWIILNRAETNNALNAEMAAEIVEAVFRAKGDPEVRVIVVTGQGRIFSKGGDLEAFAASPREAEYQQRQTNGLIAMVRTLRSAGKPTVALVNGHALAGGLLIVLACDLALAVEDAVFGTPEIETGLFPALAAALLAKGVPSKRGLWMVLTGEPITSAEAERMGLVSRVVAREKFEAASARLVADIASRLPHVVSLGRDGFLAATELVTDRALDYLGAILTKLSLSEEVRDAVRAFVQRRAGRGER